MVELPLPEGPETADKAVMAQTLGAGLKDRPPSAMSLRTPWGLDGTLADMKAALPREAERLFDDGLDLHARAQGPGLRTAIGA